MKCSLIFSLMTLTKASGTQSKVITTFRWHVNLNWISYVTYYYFQSYISQLYKWSSPGGYSWEFLVGLCRPVLQILTLFQTKKLSFSSTVFRPGVDNKRAPTKNFLKFISNSHIRRFLSYLFAIEATNMFKHYRVPSKTIPEFRPK